MTEIQNKIFIQRIFNCSRSELFKWLTKPERIAQWFGPKHLSVVEVTADLVAGGKFSIKLKKAADQCFFIHGEYLDVSFPESISFTFKYHGLSVKPPDSVVTIKLKQLSKIKSELILTQGFQTIPNDMPNRKKSWIYMFELLHEKAIWAE